VQVIGRFFKILVLLGAGLSVMHSTSALTANVDSAQSAADDSLNADAVSALVRKLDPDELSALGHLLQRLGESTEVAPDTMQPDLGDILEGWLDGFQTSLTNNLLALPDLLGGIGSVIDAVFLGRGLGGLAMFLGIVVLSVAIGACAEWLFNRLTAATREQVLATAPKSLWEQVRALALRTAIELGGLIAFVIAALLANRLLNADPTDRFFTAHIVLQPILVARVAAVLMRMVLAPNRPDLRLVSTDDWTARYLYRSLVAISTIVGISFFVRAVMEHDGIALFDALRFWVSLSLTLWLIWVLWRSRSGLTSILKGQEEELTPGLERMAAWWPAVTIAIVSFNWLLLQFVLSTGSTAISPANGALAILLVIVAPFLDTMVRGIATHMVPPMAGEGVVAEEAHRETRLSYVRIGRVFLFAFLIIVIGKLWGINLRDIAGAGLGAQFAANSAGFLLILATGYLAWEVLNLWVNRQLAREMPAAEQVEDAGPGGGGGSRLATILPIIHITLKIAIVTLTTLLALTELGVNITPLLAGAGVFGLAIGFGAQTLVKDIVAGVFYLMDDAFRVGEYIDVGGTMGTVEKISIRSFQLRGARGAVHVVPFGEIAKLTNHSRDWVIMKLQFTVPFDTDLEKVRKLFKKIGLEIAANPEHAEKLIAPFKSQGAADVTDVGIVVRGKFTTKPGAQFMIRKEIYSAVQKAFEENGIEFARREVRVKMPESTEGSNLSEEQKGAIAGAVSQAAQSAVDAEAPAKA